MSKNVMSKQELMEKREEVLELYKKQSSRARKPRTLTKKERKVLGIGKDLGKATASHVRVSASKVKLLCDQIRGKDLQEAKAMMTYSNRGASAQMLSVLKSAEANAVNNNNLDANQLYVAEVYANQGPIMKRWKARGKGSAGRINKRTCHITAVVKERE